MVPESVVNTQRVDASWGLWMYAPECKSTCMRNFRNFTECPRHMRHERHHVCGWHASRNPAYG